MRNDSEKPTPPNQGTKGSLITPPNEPSGKQATSERSGSDQCRDGANPHDDQRADRSADFAVGDRVEVEIDSRLIDPEPSPVVTPCPSPDDQGPELTRACLLSVLTNILDSLDGDDETPAGVQATALCFRLGASNLPSTYLALERVLSGPSEPGEPVLRVNQAWLIERAREAANCDDGQSLVGSILGLRDQLDQLEEDRFRLDRRAFLAWREAQGLKRELVQATRDLAGLRRELAELRARPGVAAGAKVDPSGCPRCARLHRSLRLMAAHVTTMLEATAHE